MTITYPAYLTRREMFARLREEDNERLTWLSKFAAAHRVRRAALYVLRRREEAK